MFVAADDSQEGATITMRILTKAKLQQELSRGTIICKNVSTVKRAKKGSGGDLEAIHLRGRKQFKMQPSASEPQVSRSLWVLFQMLLRRRAGRTHKRLGSDFVELGKVGDTACIGVEPALDSIALAFVIAGMELRGQSVGVVRMVDVSRQRS